ncbi:MAG: GerMN domain-containing protein, partial [Oscillospiraceae bacterium]|nr:GerMN domain-containing protein [Oscillospiraceae bacterium]
MKRITALILALLLLVGCAPNRAQKPEPVQPVTFFYRTVEVEFSDESGLIRSETRDLGGGSFSMTDIFTLYFGGPSSKSLVSPIPSGTKLLGAELSAGELTIRLQEDAAAQSGIDRSVFLACLVKTGLALEGVRLVRIRSSSPGDKLIPDQVFSDEDILLYDSGETPKTTTLTIYFSDSDRR